MAGKSPVTASDEQRAALKALAASKDRGEADRARAILLTLKGWTSTRIAEVFCVREDTVRFWRGDFACGGVEATVAGVYAGPPPWPLRGGGGRWKRVDRQLFRCACGVRRYSAWGGNATRVVQPHFRT